MKYITSSSFHCIQIIFPGFKNVVLKFRSISLSTELVKTLCA